MILTGGPERIATPTVQHTTPARFQFSNCGGCDLTIDRPQPRGTAPGDRRQRLMSFQRTVVSDRPCLCSPAQTTVVATGTALPVCDACCRTVRCFDVLEYVRDDVALAAELARILQPGGRLLLRVPFSGPLAGFDSLNLYRYLVDITHRGYRPPETDEVGWRRHYRVEDLRQLFEPVGLRIRATVTTRLVGAELINVALLFLFRWVRPLEPTYQRGQRLVRLIQLLENRIRTPCLGFSLIVEAERLPE